MGGVREWLLTLLSASLLSLVLLLLSSISGFSSPKFPPSSIQHYPPAFAYYISGVRGQREQIFRLLLAVYHPRNRYLLHLSSKEERRRLIESVSAIRAFGNVDVLGNPNYLTHMGSTNLLATLRAAAILLRLDSRWTWFITLSATDYPLVTQDDLSHVFSSLSRDLNFINHTIDLGSKELERIHRIVMDPSTYLARRSHIFKATKKRPTPDAFKVFTVLPEESYFQTVLCNSEKFKNTTVNKDLRYMVWDNPPKAVPRFLDRSNYDEMIQSESVFARKFRKNDPVLDMVDEKILKRGTNQAAMGAWCSGRSGWWIDPCSN